MSKLIKKSHNVSILMYHAVFPIKYRKALLDEEKRRSIVMISKEIEARYEIEFIEIGSDEDHVHYFVQSVRVYSPKQVIQIIKSITVSKMFEIHPEIKKDLWGGQFWSDGYYVSTVGEHSSEAAIKKYVSNQGKASIKYKQFKLF